MDETKRIVVSNKSRTGLAARRGAAAQLRSIIESTAKPVPPTPVTRTESHSRVLALRWVEQAIQIRPAELPKALRSRLFVRLFVFVVLPTLLMTAYVYLYATPRYVSELQITYQSNQPQSMSSSAGLLSSIMGGSTSSVDMSQVLQTYLMSAAAANAVDDNVHFRSHYSNRDIDWLDRLSPTASAEKFIAYFNRRVSITRQLGGFVTVDVEAFAPAFAQKVGQSLSRVADSMVARMMDQSHKDAVSLAERELIRTEDRLRQATVDMTKFRNLHSDVNIEGSANSVDTVVSGLEAQVSQTTSDIADAKSFLSDNAPSIVSLRARLSALKAQIAAERSRLGYNENGAMPVAGGKLPYSQIVADFAALQTEEKFATDSYVSAKKALDAARAMAAQKSGYVVDFVPPNLPQASTSPDPLIYILSAFFISLFAYLVGSLLIGALHDRAVA